MSERIISVPALCEFRFEVSFTEVATLTLQEGCAEIFGYELWKGKEYHIKGQKIAVFSWEGAKLSLSHKSLNDNGHDHYNQHQQTLQVEYLSDDPTSSITPNLLNILHVLAKPSPPTEDKAHRILLSGTGRSSAGKTLLNWLSKLPSEHPPILVDLDPSKSTLALPGSIGCRVMDADASSSALDPELKYLFEGKIDPPIDAGLFYFLGSFDSCLGDTSLSSPSSETTKATFLSLVKRISFALAAKTNTTVIIAPPTGQTGLKSLIELMKPTITLVIGDERMYNSLSKSATTLDTLKTSLIKSPKSGGHVSVDEGYRSDERDFFLSSYFSSISCSQDFFPFKIVIPFKDCKVKRLFADFVASSATANDRNDVDGCIDDDDGVLAPLSALPLNHTRKVTEKVKYVNFERKGQASSYLLYSIIALIHGSSNSDSGSSGNVAGYLHVTDVDEDASTFTCTSICPSIGSLELNLEVGKIKLAPS